MHDEPRPAPRRLEATPIVVGGVIYVSGAWRHALALEAKTGKLPWQFDPQIPGACAGKGCCDVVNAGSRSGAAGPGGIEFPARSSRPRAVTGREPRV
jgi:glucose dehydrogenase